MQSKNSNIIPFWKRKIPNSEEEYTKQNTENTIHKMSSHNKSQMEKQ